MKILIAPDSFKDSLTAVEAAGGLRAGILASLKGELTARIDLFIDTIGIENHLQSCDLVITGEGHLDNQFLNGIYNLKIAYSVLL